MSDLPPPINGTETYLAAVYDRLGEQGELLTRILDRLPATPDKQEPGDVVELREPAVSSAADDGPDVPQDRPAQSVQVTEPADAAEPEAADKPTSPRTRPARKRTTAKRIKES